MRQEWQFPQPGRSSKTIRFTSRCYERTKLDDFVTVGCASSTAHKMNLNLCSFAMTRGFHVETISTRIRFKTYNSYSHFEFISILEFSSYKSFTCREVRCWSFPLENRHRQKITWEGQLWGSGTYMGINSVLLSSLDTMQSKSEYQNKS